MLTKQAAEKIATMHYTLGRALALGDTEKIANVVKQIARFNPVQARVVAEDMAKVLKGGRTAAKTHSMVPNKQVLSTSDVIRAQRNPRSAIGRYDTDRLRDLTSLSGVNAAYPRRAGGRVHPIEEVLYRNWKDSSKAFNDPGYAAQYRRSTEELFRKLEEQGLTHLINPPALVRRG